MNATKKPAARHDETRAYGTSFSVDEIGAVQVLPTALLVAVAQGRVDARTILMRELAHRGLNASGVWVGFDEAARLCEAALVPLDIDRLVWLRKAEDWTDAHALDYVVRDAEVVRWAAMLPTFPAGRFPASTFPEARPQYHVVVLADGRRVLVDTQGADYARYIIGIPTDGGR